MGLFPVPMKALSGSDTSLCSEEFPDTLLPFPLPCCPSHTSCLQLCLHLPSLLPCSLLGRWGKQKMPVDQEEACYGQRGADIIPGVNLKKAPGLSTGGIWPMGKGRHGEYIRRVTPPAYKQAVYCYQMFVKPKIEFKKCSNFAGGIQKIQEIQR